jgi:hypothetical protein
VAAAAAAAAAARAERATNPLSTQNVDAAPELVPAEGKED